MLTVAGTRALVAGSQKREDAMQDATGLPEMIRVEALKGFRAPVEGAFSIVNPGDVVEVARAVAIDLRMAHKAIMTDKPLKRQKDYLPERKRTVVTRAAAAKST